MSTALAVEKHTDTHRDDLYQGEPFTRFVDGLAQVTDSDIRRYHTDGYLVVRNAFTPEVAAEARDELERMCHSEEPECLSMHFEHAIVDLFGDTGTDSSAIDTEALVSLSQSDPEQLREYILALDDRSRASLVRKFVGFTKHHPPLKHLSHHDTLRDVLGRIHGVTMKLFVSQALVKPSGGREKPWHQDHAYFDFPVETPVIGVWIALDEATPENGCMHLIPGGHTAGPRAHFNVRDWQLCDTDIENVDVVSIPLSAGDLMLFDGKLPHGTPTNRTDTQRWAVQYHYVPKDAEKVDQSVRLAAFGADGKDVFC